MKNSKNLLILLLLLVPALSFTQVQVMPSLSVGYMNHLGRNGYNGEVGVNFELFQRIDISPSFRISNMDSANPNNEVSIRAGSVFVSYVLIRNGRYRILAGPGFSFGSYRRLTEGIGFERFYNDAWFNPIKLRYEYKVNQELRVGFDATIYGDDVEGSTYLGFIIGYII